MWAQARLDAFSREVAILKSCRDRNIVLFIGACLDVRSATCSTSVPFHLCRSTSVMWL